MGVLVCLCVLGVCVCVCVCECVISSATRISCTLGHKTTFFIKFGSLDHDD